MNNSIIKNIKKDVELLLNKDSSGHDFNHINRVYDLSIKLAKNTNSNIFIIILIALLHDVDDYKLFPNSKDYENAKKILNKYISDSTIIDTVIDGISKIGYSKRLNNIKPSTIESMIVSDADMIDAIGANGIIRSIQYAISKNNPIFDKDEFPTINLTSKEYREKNTNMINHMFEKLLKLKDLMLTEQGKKEAMIRHKFMVNFLKEYFYELDEKDWITYLESYLNQNK